MLRDWWATAPLWVHSVLAGALVGVGDAVLIVRDTGWMGRTVWGVVAGAVVAVITYLSSRGRFDATRTDLADLPPSQHGTAVRAARRGPVPADPAVRAVAHTSTTE